ncbi:DNA recombination protein RmuC [Rhodovibrionaceae bacterium A322]
MLDPIILLVALAALLLGGVLVFLLSLRRGGQDYQQLDARLRQLSELQVALQNQTQDNLRQQERALSRTLEDRLGNLGKQVSDRLQETQEKQGKSLTDLRERLAVIDKAQANITELSSQVVGLQDILSNKQARGAFGEVQLHDIVSSILPPSAYSFQKTLGNGKRADCVLELPNPPGAIVIDSKFPLESYRALQVSRGGQMSGPAPDRDLAEPAAGDGETAARRAFRRDVGLHVKAIQEKYILPGETAESALLFLPSEAVYAELHANFPEVVEDSYRARVWIVSPTTLMATLNTVRAVLKDVRMREQAGVIQKEVGDLLKDMERLDDRVSKLRRHFGQTEEDLRLIAISSEKISKRGERIEGLQLEEAEDPARQLAPHPTKAPGSSPE